MTWPNQWSWSVWWGVAPTYMWWLSYQRPLFLVFFRSDYYKSSSKVHIISHVIKSILRLWDHRTTTTVVTTSHKRAVVALLPESSWPLSMISQKVFLHMPLRTSTLEQQLSSLSPYMDLKNTSNLATWWKTLTSPPQGVDGSYVGASSTRSTWTNSRRIEAWKTN